MTMQPETAPSGSGAIAGICSAVLSMGLAILVFGLSAERPDAQVTSYVVIAAIGIGIGARIRRRRRELGTGVVVGFVVAAVLELGAVWFISLLHNS